jgi:aconitate decarboxylase
MQKNVETPSKVLARFCAGLTFQVIPADVVSHAKLCILDGLGCALFGARLEVGRITADYVRDLGGKAEATFWGLGGRGPAANAALVNGTLVHSFELDDLHKQSILHPTSCALPGALAMAEARGNVSGADLLTAYIAGAEAGTRAGNCIGTAQLTGGFHPTGTLGPVAAAGAAGRIMELNADAMLHALSIGATQGAGLMSSQFESMVKRVHAGRAAQSGVMAAELAERGLTGIDTVFESDYGGFVKTLGGESADIAPLTEALGETWETARTGFKCYAACGSTHTTIDAIRELRGEHGISASDVERVDVEATTATLLHVGFPYVPGSLTGAQLNLPYAAAVTLRDGEAFVDQYTEERIADPEVIDLAGRVHVTAASDLDALGPEGRHSVRIQVTLRDGRTLNAHRRHAKGSVHDPLTREEVISKFHRLAATRIGADGARKLHDVVMLLEHEPSIESLVNLLASGSSASGLAG